MSGVRGRRILGSAVAVGVVLSAAGSALFGEIWMFLLLSGVNGDAAEWISVPISLSLDLVSIAGWTILLRGAAHYAVQLAAVAAMRAAIVLILGAPTILFDAFDNSASGHGVSPLLHVVAGLIPFLAIIAAGLGSLATPTLSWITKTLRSDS